MARTYYALWCNDTKRYMATGLNCTSKKAVKEELISYIDDDETEEDNKKASLEVLCDIFDFTLDYSNKKFVSDF
jgi:hypothetical protein